MPLKKKGGKRGSGKGTVVVQALSPDERHTLREAQEKKDRKQAREGSDPYWIASQIWSPEDALQRIKELDGYSKAYCDAQYSAITLRVIALACHAFNSARVTDRTKRYEGLRAYSEVFHRMGWLQIPREVSHRAVWIKREYSGLQAELDNILEEKDTQDQSLYYTLLNKQADLGCGAVLELFKDRGNHFGNEKFGDYTNLFMRWDANFPIRSTPPAKMRLHKGDFASYITQLLQGKSVKDIFNPDTVKTFSLARLTKLTYYGYAVDRKYEVKDSRIHGQGYFNVNHD